MIAGVGARISLPWLTVGNVLVTAGAILGGPGGLSVAVAGTLMLAAVLARAHRLARRDHHPDRR